jgi:hypothetical protein
VGSKRLISARAVWEVQNRINMNERNDISIPQKTLPEYP